MKSSNQHSIVFINQNLDTPGRAKSFFLVLSILVLVVITSSAQVTSSGVEGGRPAGSHSIDDFANVNLFNGNLNLSMPIARVGGRGGAGVTIPLTIETRWKLITGMNGEDTEYSYVPESMAGAFVNGAGKLTANITASDYYEGSCPGGWQPLVAKLVLKFTTSDGTTNQLRSVGNNGAPYSVAHCYQTQPKFNHGIEFVAWDGSGTRFISDTDVLSHVEVQGDVLSGYLVLPNGTKYRIDNGLTTWIQDRNGNRSTFTYVSGSSVYPNGFIRIDVVTDTIGRKIHFDYDQNEAPYGAHTKITFKGTGASDRIIRLTYKNLSDSLRSGTTNFPYFPVISDVWIPDGRKYTFTYSPYGLPARITVPTGGTYEYDYLVGVEPQTGGNINNGPPQINISERRIFADGITLAQKTVFRRTISSGSSITTVDEFDNQDKRLSRSKHHFHGDPTPKHLTGQDIYEDEDEWNKGREYKSEHYATDGTTLIRKSESEWEAGRSVTWNPYGAGNTTLYSNPRLSSVTVTLLDSSQVSRVEYDYDPTVTYNLRTDSYEYDYGSGQPGNLLRRSHTEYEKSSTYTTALVNILTLPKETWISSDPNGNTIVSRSKFEYDNYSTDSNHAPLRDRSNITGHDLNFGVGYSARGNITEVTSYADAQNQTGAVSAYSQYDIAGNLVKAIDAKGYASTICYNDNFGAPDAEARSNVAPSSLNGQQTFAFATSATNPIGYTGYSQYDYYTGARVDAEDLNGNVNTTFYNDIFDRPTQTISANNRPQFRKQSTIDYDDINRKTTITSDSKLYNDNLIKAESFYDQMGRTFETRQYETVLEYVVGLTEYDSLGRAYKSSTLHRPHLNEQPQWTTSTFDSLGRVTQVKTPDNAIVSRTYHGNTTTVTDQSLRKRSGSSDALGRLQRVVEDPTGLNYETTYQNDSLGRLRKTTQTEGSTTQNRYFMYDDLGRLIRAKQVEQNPNSNLAATDPITGNNNWSVGYVYDNNGNIISTTDANNRTTTGTYDNLNRLIVRDYSEPSMPDVTFTFDDPAIPHSKGQLTAITSSVSSTRYTAFDELGRIKSSQQITAGQTYAMPDYSYDFSGALVSQTYHSGRVVAIETDSIGRLSEVKSQMPTATERIYLSNISYNSFGAVEKARLGNGIWESAQFDPKRIQVTQVGLGASAGNTSFLKIDYEYGNLNLGTGAVIAGTNNGNLAKQTITVPGAGQSQGFSATQYYAYDGLNRLTTATENSSSGVQQPQLAWRQQFIYDRFGNRRFDAVNTTTLPANTGVYNPQIDVDTNKFTITDGYNYDNEGNLTSNPENQLFTYDSENRQTQVQNTASQSSANYYYDGLGKRIKKVVGDQETIFVYDAFGKLTAEYTDNQAVTFDGTKYLTADALGSPRAITDISGNVVSRHDYMPFGEEAFGGIGGRTAPQGYLPVSDGVRQHFTGYERDDESGLDYAQARYFKAKHGRFTSVDPLAASANLSDPQTFNRYAYGLNSPYKFIDPLGLAPCGVSGTTGNGKSCTQSDDEQNTVADDCDPKKPCPVKPPAIVETGLIVIDKDTGGSVTVTIGDWWSVPKVKGKSAWGWFLRLLGFDTGTGTSTPPTTTPLPTGTGTHPSSGTDAPSGDSPDSTAGDAATAAVATALAYARKKLNDLVNGEQYNGIVYRGGSDSNTNLTPRVGDLDGLSTFTKIEKATPRGGKYQGIDTSKLGSGLIAIKKGDHVSIRPRSAADLAFWMLHRGNPHPYTKAVDNAIVERNGRRPR